MEKQYLTEYLLNLDCKLINKGKINLIDADTGCGKTTLIFGKDGLIYKTNVYADIGYSISINLNRVLYVCDTQTLKDEVMKDNEEIVDILTLKGNKSYNDAGFNFDKLLLNNGKIKVCTYALLGIIMGNEYHRRKINESFDLIIFDEVHKLIDYSKKYDTPISKTYSNVINQLSAIATYSLLVCLSATPWLLDDKIKHMDDVTKSMYQYVLSKDAKKQLKSYETESELYVNNIGNIVKTLCINYNDYVQKIKTTKILLFTKRISTQKKFKDMLLEAGYRAEYLCSKNRLETQEQKDLRKYIIENKKYPDGLDILIINEAYDTGWNLKSKNVKMVLIDSKKKTEIKQVRGRVRDDIGALISIRNTADDNVNDETLKFILPSQYIGEKLTKETKDCLVKKYATIKCNNICNWQTFKDDLDVNGYVVKTTKNGSTIYNKDDIYVNEDKEIIQDNTEKLEHNECEEISKYINNILGIKLSTKEDKKPLIELINARSQNGSLLTTKTPLNNKLKKLKLPYIIRDGKSNGKRYWIIDKK
ncbi:DEAD/DEAH box helicase [Clostridium saccharoperbutylacetonicum]|uniref:DEAD/DEAH box helicase n=1 Tax=Clostridium saccharoperbutylacetonicum TaxID=36745 RepID=UPI0039E7E320